MRSLSSISSRISLKLVDTRRGRSGLGSRFLGGPDSAILGCEFHAVPRANAREIVADVHVLGRGRCRYLRVSCRTSGEIRGALIMMPTHGYGKFRSLLLGSVAAKCSTTPGALSGLPRTPKLGSWRAVSISARMIRTNTSRCRVRPLQTKTSAGASS